MRAKILIEISLALCIKKQHKIYDLNEESLLMIILY